MKQTIFIFSLILLTSYTNCVKNEKPTPAPWRILSQSPTSSSNPTPAEAQQIPKPQSTTLTTENINESSNKQSSNRWVDDGTILPEATVRTFSLLDKDIQVMLDKDKIDDLMKNDRARGGRKLLRAVELVTRENLPDREWYENAAMQGAERINDTKLVVNPDEAQELATRFERMQLKYEKELSEITKKMLKRIFLLRRAGDILLASGDGHSALQEQIQRTLNRNYVRTPRELTATMYQHGFYNDEENQAASSSSE
jgi:hypothetical protein